MPTEGRGTYTYTSSQLGTPTYRVLIPRWLGTDLSGSAGFAADDGTSPPLPRYLKMRYVTATSTTSARHRKLHIGNITASLWASTNVSVTLPTSAGDTEVFKTVGNVGERRRGGIS